MLVLVVAVIGAAVEGLLGEDRRWVGTSPCSRWTSSSEMADLTAGSSSVGSSSVVSSSVTSSASFSLVLSMVTRVEARILAISGLVSWTDIGQVDVLQLIVIMHLMYVLIYWKTTFYLIWWNAYQLKQFMNKVELEVCNREGPSSVWLLVYCGLAGPPVLLSPLLEQRCEERQILLCVVGLVPVDTQSEPEEHLW